MSLDLTQQMELYQEKVIRCLVSAKLLGPEIQKQGCQMQKGLASLNGLTTGTGIIGKSLNFQVRLAWVKVLVLLLSGFFVSEPQFPCLCCWGQMQTSCEPETGGNICYHCEQKADLVPTGLTFK